MTSSYQTIDRPVGRAEGPAKVTGVSMTETPVTSEKLFRAMEVRRRGASPVVYNFR